MTMPLASTAARSPGDVTYHVQIVGNGERARIDHELSAQGLALPFSSRAPATELAEYRQTDFLTVRDDAGRIHGGFAIHCRRAPLIPQQMVAWVEQFGASVAPAATDAAVAGLVKWLERHPRVLRLSVDVFSFDPERRQAIGRILRTSGFHAARWVNGYRETLVLDLSPSEDELFAGLHHSARRKIRQIQKHAVEIRTVDDAMYADRMNALLQETFARTGGTIPARDWAGRIDHAVRNPNVSRIAGLFRTDVMGPDALIAYAWGCHGTDHVYYSEAASTRDIGEQKIAVAYGVMWDLILWAKRTGALVFDFGGITRGTHTDEDPLGGISDFKRYFSEAVVEVRDEWVMDDHSWRARMATAVHGWLNDRRKAK